MDELRTVAGLVNLFLLIATALVLAWFVWRVFLRKLWRVRRIENARLKRILAEKGSQTPED